MDEAKYSVNVRFNLKGYDCQFTARTEEEQGLETLLKAKQIVLELERMGATGERRWEAAKNGHTNGQKEAQAKPNPKSDNDHSGGTKQGLPASVPGLLVPSAKGETGVVGTLDDTPCPNCGAVGEVEIIGFNRGGTYKQAPKCQACKKWLPADSPSQDDLPF